jgi:signal peptidase II
LQAGIFGNVMDRLILGYTRDFIPFRYGDFRAFYNVADIFLFIAVFSIIFIIFRYDKLLWIPDNSRSNYLINPKEQLRLAFKFFMIAIFTSILIGLFSYTFIKVYLEASPTSSYDYIVAYSILSILFSLSTFIAGIFISHKSSGPLYAFELYVENLIAGKDQKLQLRDGDNYKHLEQIALKLYSHFHKK